MYGFTEIRTHDEKYVLSSLIDEMSLKPHKKWLSLTVYEDGEVSIERTELDYWDNEIFLKEVLLPNLKKVYEDDITMKQFHKILNSRELGDKTSEELFPTKENVEELYKLFQFAEKLNMI